MSYSEEVEAEIRKEMAGASQEQPQETQQQPQETVSTETPTETPPEQKTAPEGPETQSQDTPVETQQQEPPQEQPAETQQQQQEHPQENTKPAKPDLSTLSKEEKAQHAFQRQLAKQKEKYEASIQELTGNFQKQIDELKTSMKKQEPKKVLTRDMFDTDDEFIRALADERVKEIMEGRDEEARKKEDARKQAEAEQAKVQQQLAEQANTFKSNCSACFTDENERGAFEAQLSKATANGLADVLDQAPAVREFIFTDPDGPRVLNAMLQDKAAFMRVMGRAGNPMACVIEMHDMARELKAPQVQQQQQQQEQPRSVMPHIGKPGAGGAGASTPSIWNSDEDLINFCRKGRHI